jgi:hypothetical protein
MPRGALSLLLFACAGVVAAQFHFQLRREVSRVPTRALSAHPAYRHHGRRLQDEFSVYGDFRALAYFYADLFIGTPTPQKFTVITDTGSTLAAVPCFNCGSCGTHMDPKYQPSASTTAVALRCGDCGGYGCNSESQCTYSQGYAEGSHISGVLYRDEVYLGSEGDGLSSAAGSYRTAFTFGCQLHEDGLFLTQEADGILGLGIGDFGFVNTLWASGKLRHKLFSVCLSFHGGAMGFGDVEHRLHDAPLAWARMSLTGFYQLHVAGWALEGERLPADGFNSPHTILDSGTTFTYVPAGPYQALRERLAAWCGGGGGGRCKGSQVSVTGEDLCYRLADPSHIATFPSATIELEPSAPGGAPATLTIRPQYLFVDMGWDGGAYCLAVYNNYAAGGVVGANAMMENDVVVDLTGESGSGPRAGFAPSKCRLDALGDPTPSPSPSETPSTSATPTSTLSVGATASGTPSPSPTTTATPSLGGAGGLEEGKLPSVTALVSGEGGRWAAVVLGGGVLAAGAAWALRRLRIGGPRAGGSYHPVSAPASASAGGGGGRAAAESGGGSSTAGSGGGGVGGGIVVVGGEDMGGGGEGAASDDNGGEKNEVGAGAPPPPPRPPPPAAGLIAAAAAALRKANAATAAAASPPPAVPAAEAAPGRLTGPIFLPLTPAVAAGGRHASRRT